VPLRIVEHFTDLCHSPSQCQHGMSFLIVASPGDKRNDRVDGLLFLQHNFEGISCEDFHTFLKHSVQLQKQNTISRDICIGM